MLDRFRLEAAHFTPWLAENLQVLDYIGLGPLELVQVEKQVGGTLRSLDILGRRATGEFVAIENQYGKTDHDHLTRGLAYAVGLQATALVVISENHLDEFRAVAAYLNAIAERSKADDAIAVYLVEVTVERVEECVIPRFHVVESPNEWLGNVPTPEAAVGSIEEFIGRVPVEAQPSFREVAELWLQQPGCTIRFGASTAISLDRPHPRRRGLASQMTLNVNGGYTIQRKFLFDSGSVPPDAQDAFDAFVHDTFPDVAWSPQGVSLTSNRPPRLEAVQSFLQWLTDHAAGAQVSTVQADGATPVPA